MLFLLLLFNIVLFAFFYPLLVKFDNTYIMLTISILELKKTLENYLFSQKPFGVHIASSVLCQRFKNNSSSPYTLISSCT